VLEKRVVPRYDVAPPPPPPPPPPSPPLAALSLRAEAVMNFVIRRFREGRAASLAPGLEPGSGPSPESPESLDAARAPRRGPSAAKEEAEALSLRGPRSRLRGSALHY
ncbi:hypothetical protein KM043_000063, partial [Ampulex compressa]